MKPGTADATLPGSTDLDGLFGPDGPLAASLENFAPRPEQLAMAEAVARAISEARNLVVEAGTGTGKTLAYLVPLLLGGGRGLVSTGTRTLQDQLFHRDLPLLCEALGRPAQVRLLKGRANYLCLHRLDQLQQAGDIPSGSTAAEVEEVQRWSQRTRTGDLAELSAVGESVALLGRISSTADNCLGSSCAFLADCHLAAARQAAREADIVVVNHHLLMADLTMREEGFGRLLPGYDVVIVDEAHHFPDVAQAFFNKSLSSGQVWDLLDDVRAEALEAGHWGPVLEGAVDALRRDVREARLSIAGPEGQRSWSDAGESFAGALDDIGEALQNLAAKLDPDASNGLRRCRERARALSRSVGELLSATDAEALRWVRVTPRSFSTNLTPLDSAPEIAALLQSQDCTWVFTSATLAVGDDFRHFGDRLGLADFETRQVPSPFDYPAIARLYLPTGLPEPAAAEFTARVVAAVRPVLEASRGRAFLLFTSHRALREAARLLRESQDFDFPLLVQGEAPRTRLLEAFAELEDGVLLGTATFWEGVDIRGHGLVLVMIDRLPFASPGDPLLAARLQAIRDSGGNPFRDYQLPQAVLALKQGVGRLIRDYDDYGVVMICDSRLQSKSYGRVFRESLPPMPILREVEAVLEFYREQETTR